MLTLRDAEALFAQRRDAWLRRDLAAYLACWAEDMTFQSPVHAEPLRGRAAFGDLVRASMDFSTPVRFDFTQMAVRGDTVLAEWVITIERVADHRRVEWWGMSVAEIRDGLIRRWREYWNPADVV